MTTNTKVAAKAAAPKIKRQVGWRHNPQVRRLGACLFTGLILALMTGPNGTTRNFYAGLKGALFHPRLFVFLGIGVVLWSLFWLNETYGKQTKGTLRINEIRSAGAHAFSHRWVQALGVLVILAFVIIYPTTLSNFWLTVLFNQICIYVLLAIGLNVVVGFAGLLDLGYIAFFAIGAYTTAFFTGSLPVKPPMDLNPFLIFPIAVVVCLIAGIVLGAPVLRLRGDYLAIVTLGFGEIIRIVAVNSDSITNGPRGAINIPHFSINLFDIHYKWNLAVLPYYYMLLACIVVIYFLFRRLEHSRVGRAWVAIREDEVAAAASGIWTLKYKILAFAIGASTSGFAGVFYASKVAVIAPDNFILLNSILILILVIFGGMGSQIGVIVGAVAIMWLPEILRGVVPAQDRYLYFGALLVVMMIFRPQGLIPEKRRKRELGVVAEPIVASDPTLEGVAK